MMKGEKAIRREENLGAREVQKRAKWREKGTKGRTERKNGHRMGGKGAGSWDAGARRRNEKAEGSQRKDKEERCAGRTSQPL